MSRFDVILVAGGTGGHVFPATAVSDLLRVKGYRVLLVTDGGFLFCDHGEYSGEVYILPLRRSSGNFAKKIQFYMSVALSCVKSFILLVRHRPRVVVGFGGYTSFPVILMARLLFIDIILHEQNTVLGRVNKWFQGVAKKIALSFPSVAFLKSQYLHKSVLTGNPVRLDGDKHYDVYGDKFNIVVIGGSQGATVFTHIVPEMLSMLPHHLRDVITVSHQCPERDVAYVKECYHEFGIKHEVSRFFCNVDELVNNASLIISRAGATFMAEVNSLGRPVIYVPYPHSVYDHQYHNAKYMEGLGAAIIIMQKDLSVEHLYRVVLSLMHDKVALSEMAKKSLNAHIEHSVERVTKLIEESIHCTL